MRKLRTLIAVCLMALFTLSLSITVFAEENTRYVFDHSTILTESELAKLENKARGISEEYHCNVYIMTVNDFHEFDAYTVEDAAKKAFLHYDMGYGADRDGFLLFLSMSGRDYCLLAHGDFGNASLTDYGKDQMSEDFLDEFGDDDWYDGFSDYLKTSEKYLKMSKKGKPFDYRTDPVARLIRFIMSYGFFGIAGIIIGFLTGGIMKKQMESTKTATEANYYVKLPTVRFDVRSDHYTHMTHTSHRIVTHTSSGGGGGSHGGTTIGSGGFSSKSGKF